MRRFRKPLILFTILLQVTFFASCAIPGSQPKVAAPLRPGPNLISRTSWTHLEDDIPYGDLRGLAYDGIRYYLADVVDSPFDRAGHIYIYNENSLVKIIPEIPPVQGRFFPSGVATDGTSLWTGDYWGKTIYRYNINSGTLMGTFKVPFDSPPVRMDFDQMTQSLWITAYNDSTIYNISLEGRILKTISTRGFGASMNIALDGEGGILVACSEAEVSSGSAPKVHLLRRYSLDGRLLEEYPFVTGWWGMATNINDRSAGFIQDTQPILNSSGSFENRIQHYLFP